MPKINLFKGMPNSETAQGFKRFIEKYIAVMCKPFYREVCGTNVIGVGKAAPYWIIPRILVRPAIKEVDARVSIAMLRHGKIIIFYPLQSP